MRKAAEQSTALAGVRILAVEDDYVVLLDIAMLLANAGAIVVKCTTVEQALQAIAEQAPTAAVLDVRIGRNTVAPVARQLTDLGVPFVFYTGQVTREPSMSQWSRVPVISKPAAPAVLLNALTAALRASEPHAHDR